MKKEGGEEREYSFPQKGPEVLWVSIKALHTQNACESQSPACLPSKQSWSLARSSSFKHSRPREALVMTITENSRLQRYPHNRCCHQTQICRRHIAFPLGLSAHIPRQRHSGTFRIFIL